MKNHYRPEARQWRIHAFPTLPSSANIKPSRCWQRMKREVKGKAVDSSCRYRPGGHIGNPFCYEPYTTVPGVTKKEQSRWRVPNRGCTMYTVFPVRELERELEIVSCRIWAHLLYSRAQHRICFYSLYSLYCNKDSTFIKNLVVESGL